MDENEQQRDSFDRESLLALKKAMPLLRRFVTPMDEGVIRSVKSIRKAIHEQLLMLWAGERAIPGSDPFKVRGSLISSSMQGVRVIAEALNGQLNSKLKIEDANTAGFRVLRVLSHCFAPDQDGNDFFAFATPYVTAAIIHCHRNHKLMIEDGITLQQLKELRATYDPLKHGNREKGEASDPTAGMTKHALPPSITPTPPHPIGPKASRTIEVTAASLQRKSFCEWAKREHAVNVGENAFEDAVTKIAEKFQPLAKNVANKFQIPGSFPGGKHALRQEAAHVLRGFVDTFDPNGPTHFNQYLTELLEAHLTQFVKRHGRN